MRLVAVAFAAVLAASAGSAGAVGLIDGSFEIKGAALPVTDYCYDSFATPGGPACAAGAWVGNGIIHTGSAPWGSPAAPDGTYLSFVQGTGSLSQTFTNSGSGTHTLAWSDAGRSGGGFQTYSVTLSDGTTTTLLGTYSTVAGQAFGGKSLTARSLVDGASYTLAFNGLVAADQTAFIDAVSLTTVPEPASWALMIAGFGLVGAAARRRSATLAA